ncbi:MAG TPA: folylpolyglutamate synthase/dihydrofolate synthase family protein [Thermodesulfovibrionales bacterium]|nr:folylpolyglutamate synthase/dihydrofolate synthase family protein [Thermodesulfovibrionales bacterium]
MTKYNDAVAYLYSLQKYGIKLGLDNTRRLLSLLGNPQGSFMSIHVAGTNGKGSTSAMIASILKTSGCKVGLFTSPHLVSFTERIRVDNKEISEQEVVDLTNEIMEIVRTESEVRSRKSEAERAGSHELSAMSHEPFLPTFFEFVTAMGFLYFERKGVECAVVETGMGGRLDATNVLTPKVSVITSIGYDHREFLGQTIGEIAGEKAGIIKSGIPVVSSSQEHEALKIIAGKASEKKTPLFLYGKDFLSYVKSSDVSGIKFDYEGGKRLKDLYVPLCGMHQIENASVAVKTVELVMKEGNISDQSVKEGLARTKWPGRLELIKDPGLNYDLLIDGAHNPSASRALAEALKAFFVPFYDKVILILGIMADKDVAGIMKPLLPLASETIFTAPGYERAASPETLAEYASEMGFAPKVTHSMREALDLANATAKASSLRTLTVITGSFYTIGEAKMCLGQEGVLARLRE